MFTRSFLLLTVITLIACSGNPQEFSSNNSSKKAIGNDPLFENGDLIFQTSLSAQSKAIQLATHSKYSHIGIIYIMDDDYFVFEAIQPVKITPLKKWIQRGKNEHYVVKRLINSTSVLTPTILKKMKKEGNQFKGKNYDFHFEWTDDQLYCSELVWKLYKRAVNVELGKLQNLGDLDLSHPIVKSKLADRYGKEIPLHEKVISPAAIYNSSLLETIFEN